eukprot:COSAG04_NODE_1912_length_5248_cov_4.464945_3_plen_671_part_00
MHKNQKFKVAITQWNPRSPGFTIKHKDEPAFVISYDHIWPYLHEAQQQHVLDQGGTPSNNSEEVLAQYGSGGNGKRAKPRSAPGDVDGDGKPAKVGRTGRPGSTSPRAQLVSNLGPVGAVAPVKRERRASPTEPSPRGRGGSPREMAGHPVAGQPTSASGRPIRQAAAQAAAAKRLQEQQEEEQFREEEEQERQHQQAKMRQDMQRRQQQQHQQQQHQHQQLQRQRQMMMMAQQHPPDANGNPPMAQSMNPAMNPPLKQQMLMQQQLMQQQQRQMQRQMQQAGYAGGPPYQAQAQAQAPAPGAYQAPTPQAYYDPAQARGQGHNPQLQQMHQMQRQEYLQQEELAGDGQQRKKRRRSGSRPRPAGAPTGGGYMVPPVNSDGVAGGQGGPAAVQPGAESGDDASPRWQASAEEQQQIAMQQQQQMMMRRRQQMQQMQMQAQMQARARMAPRGQPQPGQQPGQQQPGQQPRQQPGQEWQQQGPPLTEEQQLARRQMAHQKQLEKWEQMCRVGRQRGLKIPIGLPFSVQRAQQLFRQLKHMQKLAQQQAAQQQAAQQARPRNASGWCPPAPGDLTQPLGVFGETSRPLLRLSPRGGILEGGEGVDVDSQLPHGTEPAQGTPKPKMNWRDPPPLKPAPLKPELYGLSQWLGLGFNTHQGSLPVPGRCVHPLVQR